MQLTICLAEDRVAEEAGVRLALLSLREHHPEATILLYRPNPGGAFCEWLQAFPHVTLISDWPGTPGWNCKPQALLDALDRGFDSVVWLDSDILVTRRFEHLFEHLDDETLVVAQDPAVSFPQGSPERTKGWSLAMGRNFPRTMNTCILRVTKAHRPLLARWNQMLSNPDYLEAQSKPTHERPFYFYGDQDAFTALLGSAEFANVPVSYLRRGRDLVHAGGARTYSLKERLAGLFHRIPPFIHTQWSKPWIVLNPTTYPLPGRFWFYHRIILEASPYVALARTYRRTLGMESSWMTYSSLPGRILRILGLGHFALRGMPLTAVATTVAGFNKLKGQPAGGG